MSLLSDDFRARLDGFTSDVEQLDGLVTITISTENLGFYMSAPQNLNYVIIDLYDNDAEDADSFIITPQEGGWNHDELAGVVREWISEHGWHLKAVDFPENESEYNPDPGDPQSLWTIEFYGKRTS